MPKNEKSFKRAAAVAADVARRKGENVTPEEAMTLAGSVLTWAVDRPRRKAGRLAVKVTRKGR